MAKPKVIVLGGYGINCEQETVHAFRLAGAQADIVHINDLVDGRTNLVDYQILAFPGGFSYGDDTGSGNALAHRIKNHLWERVLAFVQGDRLAIGICNGFQIMVNLGLLPATGGDYGQRQVALIHNTSARYLCRWVDLRVHGDSPWLRGMDTLSLPIAHGEGNFYAPADVLGKLQDGGLVALTYAAGEICAHLDLEPNPNGSLVDIAGLTDPTGRLLGLMPHPERAVVFTQLPHWTWLKEKHLREGQKIPERGPGLRIFQNAVEYFR
jgi:phosphoribosylformylglycinamidine synthase I